MTFQTVIQEAQAAGIKAGIAAVPVPMGVIEVDPLSGMPKEGSELHVLDEGACGFAWIWFPGNTAFGKFAKKAGLARSSYPTGLQIWVSQFGQSITRKEAYAKAFAQVLNAHGIKAYADSRLD